MHFKKIEEEISLFECNNTQKHAESRPALAVLWADCLAVFIPTGFKETQSPSAFTVEFKGALARLNGEGNGSPLQYSCLGNLLDRGVWLATVSVQFSSVAQSCPTLCDPMNHSTPGLPVHHQLPEFTQTHVHRVGDAIQPSHPLSSPSPPALNLF